ncbi:hypothetical protein B0T18DRAFT_485977 [Schizothecium vesticola]|uniref:Uncharacterized protein n=1 Tax=Schizothecium vesticola TaxID=314040 RepID=A0AA40F5E7_9PEZI|nr:hypothetical protein B0T18DRAFT_485977 [Schizothecium vesticola]
MAGKFWAVFVGLVGATLLSALDGLVLRKQERVFTHNYALKEHAAAGVRMWGYCRPGRLCAAPVCLAIDPADDHTPSMVDSARAVFTYLPLSFEEKAGTRAWAEQVRKAEAIANDAQAAGDREAAKCTLLRAYN